MARTATTNPDAHRVLDSTLKGAQLGEDVGKLQAATRNRLGARGYRHLPARDEQMGPKTAHAAADALWALGAAPSTVRAARKGRVTIGAQRLVRYPGRRTRVQLGLATARKPVLRRRVKRANATASSSGGGSGSVTDRRKRATSAATFALNHNGRRYSQGPDRWDPIRSGAIPGGHMWSVADCSAFATWVVWHAQGRGGTDVVNGQDWSAGYTGSMRVHGVRVTSGHYEPGDCVIYGGGTGKHTAVCYRAGTSATSRWASHGSAGGPYSVSLDYRGDRSDVRRYIR